MAVEQILADIDIERRRGFPMQRTQPHKLRGGAHAAPLPMAAPQVIQQRKALFELFQVLLHRPFGSHNRAYEETAKFPRQGWWVRKFFRGAGARARADAEKGPG